ncbi:MAG: acetyl xylan esterase [Verrucomicrobiae bacterium]|nr:acetyl xylan esterase [Verrucomicrobiae bacterium]
MKPLITPLIALAGFAAVVLPTSAADEKPAHLFILSGQSNMAGMNPKTGFEPETALLFPDADVAYLKVAAGGQPIRYWVAEWNEIARKHGIDPAAARAKDKNKEGTIFYQPILDQFAGLLKKHPHPASVTFCWMQGERDAKENLDVAYYDALKQLIENLRRDLKQPDMRFVIGRLSDFGKADNAPWEAVRAAQVKLAEDDPLGAWVDCDDLNNKEKDGVTRDDLHYTPEGYELLGRRYARQAKAMIEGKEPAKDGRPE